MIKAFIDLDGAQPGKTTYKNLIDSIKIPNGTKITSISPAELSFTLESTISKKVPVHLNLVEGPQEGYEVTQIAIQPEFVEVRLALSEVGKIKKVITEPLYLSGVKEDIERELVLVLPGLDLPGSLRREKVKVSLSISEKIIEKTLSSIPVGVVNSPYRTSITPATIQLEVKCPYRLAEALSGDDISASIDLEGVKPGKYLKKADIKLPGAVSLIETVPLRFEVVVENKVLRD
jgi:YbbR domain-containing protein